MTGNDSKGPDLDEQIDPSDRCFVSASKNTQLHWREVIVWAIVLCLLLLVHFPGFFFRGERMSGFDCHYVVHPWASYAPDNFTRPGNTLLFDQVMSFRPDAVLVQEAYRNGRLPLWNPLEYAGMPLMANCQSQAFVPSNVLSLLFFDVDTAMSLQILWRVFLAGMLSYISLRMMGSNVWASRYYSILWTFCPYFFNWLYWPLTNVNAWWPIVFAGTELLRRGALSKGFLLISLGGYFMLIGGHPQTAFVLAAYTSLYFMFSMFFNWRDYKTVFVLCAVYAAAWVLALGMAGIQVVPFLDYLQQYSASEVRAFVTPLKVSASFFVARFWGSEVDGTFGDSGILNSFMASSRYVGLAALAGLVFLFMRSLGQYRDNRYRQSVLLLACAVTSAGISMAIPPFSFFLYFESLTTLRLMYHITFLSAALPLLGAWGLERWFETPRQHRKLWWLVLVIIPAVSVISASAVHASDASRIHIERQIIVALIFACSIAPILFMSCYKSVSRNLLWTLLIGITFLDLAWATHKQNPTMPREQIQPETNLLEYLREKPQPCRTIPMLFDGDFVGVGAMGNYGIEEWTGYDGLFPERTETLFTFERVALIYNFRRILGAEYILAQSGARDWSESFVKSMVAYGFMEHEITLDGVDVYRINDVLPRVRLVGKIELVNDMDDLLTRLADVGRPVNVEDTVLTTTCPSGALPRTDGDIGDATITRYENEQVLIHCSAKANAALVLADTYFSGWKAFVDGRPTEIFPAYGAFRGILVPNGEHTVEFRYEPLSFRIGLILSCLSCFVWLLIFYIRAGRCVRSKKENAICSDTADVS